jgi:hypothetical protein
MGRLGRRLRRESVGSEWSAGERRRGVTSGTRRLRGARWLWERRRRRRLPRRRRRLRANGAHGRGIRRAAGRRGNLPRPRRLSEPAPAPAPAPTRRGRAGQSGRQRCVGCVAYGRCGGVQRRCIRCLRRGRRHGGSRGNWCRSHTTRCSAGSRRACDLRNARGPREVVVYAARFSDRHHSATHGTTRADPGYRDPGRVHPEDGAALGTADVHRCASSVNSSTRRRRLGPDLRRVVTPVHDEHRSR